MEPLRIGLTGYTVRVTPNLPPQILECYEKLAGGEADFLQAFENLKKAMVERDPTKKTLALTTALNLSADALGKGYRTPKAYSMAANAANQLSKEATGEAKISLLRRAIDYATKAQEPCCQDVQRKIQEAASFFDVNWEEITTKERSIISASLGSAQFDLSLLVHEEQEMLLRNAKKNMQASIELDAEVDPTRYSLMGTILFALSNETKEEERKELLVQACDHYKKSLSYAFQIHTDYYHLGSVYRELAKYENDDKLKQVHVASGLKYLYKALENGKTNAMKANVHLLISLILIETDKGNLLERSCQESIGSALQLGGAGNLELYDQLDNMMHHYFYHEESLCCEPIFNLLKQIWSHIIRYGNIDDPKDQRRIAGARMSLFNHRSPFKEIASNVAKFNKNWKEKKVVYSGCVRVSKTNTPFFGVLHLNEDPEFLDNLRKKINALRPAAEKENPDLQSVKQLAMSLWVLAKSTQYQEKSVLQECYRWLKQTDNNETPGCLGVICSRLAVKTTKEKDLYLKEAEESLLKAITYGKNLPNLYRELGRVFWSQARHKENDQTLLEKSLEAFKKALTLQMQQDEKGFLEPEIYAELGDVQRLLGLKANTLQKKIEFYNQAKMNLENALDRGHDHPVAIFSRLSKMDQFFKANEDP